MSYSLGSFHDVGSTCVGLVFPDQDCAHESRDNDTHAALLSSGLRVSLGGWKQVGLAVMPTVGFGAVGSKQTGERTGRERSAGKAVYALLFASELRMSLMPQLWLATGASVGRMAPLSEDRVVDGYAPFEDTFNVRRYYVQIGRRW